MDWVWRQATEVVPDGTRWRHAGLRLADLEPGVPWEVDTAGVETIVLPLAGSCSVRLDGERYPLTGRADVFSGRSDLYYLPPGVPARLEADVPARVALPFAAATGLLPPRYLAGMQTPVELRGAGACSRQVHNVATADTFACEKLIVVEVLTPGGNWSSFPPHKHDTAGPDETALEEIYYFEVAGGGVGYQRVATADPARPIDVLAEVSSGDVVLVSFGWHGPSIASPGRDLYYLNVMAGDERAWRICDDPEYAWVRPSWTGVPVDDRLPVGDRRAEGIRR
jgi:5-deoxy-glucuronate isomerase